MEERAVEMSPIERATQCILVVEPDPMDRNHLRELLIRHRVRADE